MMFKRLFFKSFVLLVIFAGGGAYLSYTMGIDVTAMTGKLLQFARLGDLNLETMRIDSQTVEDDSQVLQAGEQRVYKWQDQSGQWHYTQIRPPADARAVESIDLDPMQNVIAGFRAPVDDSEPLPEEKVKPMEPLPDPAAIVPASPYSPEAIEKLFKDAEGLQETLGNRYQAQQQLLGR